MKIEKVYNDIRYTLSNDNNKVGDLVYPIARGRHLNDGSFILHELDFRYFMCGFPDEPHTIKDIQNSSNRQETRTDMGYSHPDVYFKIIKKEHQVKIGNEMFSRLEWTELPE